MRRSKRGVSAAILTLLLGCAPTETFARVHKSQRAAPAKHPHPHHQRYRSCKDSRKAGAVIGAVTGVGLVGTVVGGAVGGATGHEVAKDRCKRRK